MIGHRLTDGLAFGLVGGCGCGLGGGFVLPSFSFSALALVAPAFGGWLGASLSLVVVVVGRRPRWLE